MRKFGNWLVMAGMVLPGAVAVTAAIAAEEAGCEPKVVVVPLSSSNTAVGDAVAADVLAGKTFSTASATGVTGTMVDNGGVTIVPGTSNQTIAAGYHNGFGEVEGDADLLSANIKSGVEIFGTTGTFEAIDTSSGDAVGGDILAGKKAWVDGAEVTGTMPTQTLSSVTSSVSAGYYAATDLTTADSDLATANIKAGTTIFGVSGTAEVVNTSSGDAVAGDILAGKKAWVDGAEVTGTMPTQTLSDATTTVSAGYYGATNLATVDTDLATANIKAGTTIFGISGTAEVVDTSSGDAVAGDILAGKKAWVDGAEMTGTMPTQTISDATTTVSAGYYAATDLATEEADLVAANIKNGVEIYGITGSYVAVAPAVARAWGCNLDGGTGVSAPWDQTLCETDCDAIFGVDHTFCNQICGGIEIYLGTAPDVALAREKICNTPLL